MACEVGTNNKNCAWPSSDKEALQTVARGHTAMELCGGFYKAACASVLVQARGRETKSIVSLVPRVRPGHGPQPLNIRDLTALTNNPMST